MKTEPGLPARCETGTFWRARVKSPDNGHRRRGGWINFTIHLDEPVGLKRCPGIVDKCESGKEGGPLLAALSQGVGASASAVPVYTFGKDGGWSGPLISLRRSSQILSGISRKILTMSGSNCRPDQSSISLRAASMLCALR